MIQTYLEAKWRKLFEVIKNGCQTKHKHSLNPNKHCWNEIPTKEIGSNCVTVNQKQTNARQEYVPRCCMCRLHFLWQKFCLFSFVSLVNGIRAFDFGEAHWNHLKFHTMSPWLEVVFVYISYAIKRFVQIGKHRVCRTRLCFASCSIQCSTLVSRRRSFATWFKSTNSWR